MCAWGFIRPETCQGEGWGANLNPQGRYRGGLRNSKSGVSDVPVPQGGELGSVSGWSWRPLETQRIRQRGNPHCFLTNSPWPGPWPVMNNQCLPTGHQPWQVLLPVMMHLLCTALRVRAGISTVLPMKKRRLRKVKTSCPSHTASASLGRDWCLEMYAGSNIRRNNAEDRSGLGLSTGLGLPRNEEFPKTLTW